MKNINQTKNIVQRCSIANELTNSEIKNMFKMLALSIEELRHHGDGIRFESAGKVSFEDSFDR